MHGLHGYSALYCLRAAGASDNLVYMWVFHSIFRLVFQGDYVVRCPLVRMDWPGQPSKSFFGQSGFACRPGLNTRGGFSGVDAGGGIPLRITHPKINTERRAHKKTIQHLHNTRTEKTQVQQ